jgi:hypothetical protein
MHGVSPVEDEIQHSDLWEANPHGMTRSCTESHRGKDTAGEKSQQHPNGFHSGPPRVY